MLIITELKCALAETVSDEPVLMHLNEFLEWSAIVKDAVPPLFAPFFTSKSLKLIGREPLAFTEDAHLH